MRYQLIMHNSLEPNKEPDITRGTLEGDIAPGSITLFRLQSTADAQLRAYIAEGEVLHIPLALSEFLQYTIWLVSTAMSLLSTTILITEQLPLLISDKRLTGYSDTSVLPR